MITCISSLALLAALASLPPHPRLLLTSDGLARLKDRIDHCTWAKARWLSLKQRADELVGREVLLPPRGGNWGHWYVCPVHGAGLRTGREIGQWQWEHICPVGNEVYKGDAADPSRDYDGCAIARIHGDWSNAVRDLGVVYQVTGEARYAAKAREILLAYADRYASYPLHTTRGEPKLGGGRVGSQTLDESVWLIPVCQGADLIWDTLSADDRAAITGKLLVPAVREVILPHKLGIHNIQCWKNSAVGLVGFLIGDQELISEAIDDPERGYRVQMAKGVLPDGDWWEGSWGYHFYTLSALWSLTEAARNCGTDLYGPPLKGMFDAPLSFAMPNLNLPAFSDSRETSLTSAFGLYEIGYARYRAPAYLSLLARSDRTSDYALWFGEEKLPRAPRTARASANYPRSGYAILTRGTGDQAAWLCLKYGPHGGGHGHPDKLGFVLYARGGVIGIDPGLTSYGSPIQAGWYRTTLAHNTLIADEASQKPAEGKCIAFGNERGVDYVVAEAGPIYDGVRFVRTAAMLDQNLIVFVDQIACDKEHALDIACHLRGAWEDPPFGTPWPTPEKPGYSYLRDAEVRKLDGGVTLISRLSADRRVSITLASGEPTDVITATGIGANTEDRVPVAIFRRKAASTVVIWAIALDGRPPKIDQLPAQPDAGDGLQPVAARVTDADGKTWYLLTNPDARPAAVSLPDASTWHTAAPFAVR